MVEAPEEKVFSLVEDFQQFGYTSGKKSNVIIKKKKKGKRI